MTKKQILSVVMLGAALIYDAMPADLIPDVPLIGWADDFLLTSSAAMNCLEQFSAEGSHMLRKVLRWLKWVCLLLVVLIFLLLAVLVKSMVSLL